MTSSTALLPVGRSTMPQVPKSTKKRPHQPTGIHQSAKRSRQSLEDVAADYNDKLTKEEQQQQDAGKEEFVQGRIDPDPFLPSSGARTQMLPGNTTQQVETRSGASLSRSRRELDLAGIVSSASGTPRDDLPSRGGGADAAPPARQSGQLPHRGRTATRSFSARGGTQISSHDDIEDSEKEDEGGLLGKQGRSDGRKSGKR